MRVRRLLVIGLCAVAWPRAAMAGMPTIQLTDMAFARLSTISFFLIVLLLSAWAVKAIWNSLTVDVPRLPRLSYRRALGLVVLWGLLFLLVLTMISGARELMTPGAWVRQGYLSKLASEPAPAQAPRSDRAPGLISEVVRQEKLVQLRRALWAYTRKHDGHFPPDDQATPEVPEPLWQLPDPSGLRYLYVPGRKPGQLGAVVAYEPGLFGPNRWVLLADGEERLMSVEALRKALDTPPKPEGH
jgi:hypothetical protein